MFVENCGTVRVGDFSIDKRIRDLWQGQDRSERFPLAIGKSAKKTDVHRFGVLMLSLALGDVVQDEPRIPLSAFAPEFADFLRNCLAKDEKDRPSCEQLLSHRWLKESLKRSPLKAHSPPDAPDDDVADADVAEEETAVPFVSVGSGTSRLQSEFSFISKIGEGGFGEVMKVRNTLDQKVYAIKKIRLSSRNKQATRKLMREVKLLSRLNHENVVRYYTSWIEVTTIDESGCDESSASFVTEEEDEETTAVSVPATASKKTKSLLDGILLKLGPNLDSSIRTGSSMDFSLGDDECGQDDEDEDDEEDDEGSEESAFGTSFLPTDDLSGGSDDDDIVFENSSGATASKGAGEDEDRQAPEVETAAKPLEIRFMYIQMEFCDNRTLRDAIDRGLYKDTERVWRMFFEILSGLSHLHTQGMIHRDMKGWRTPM